MMRTLSHTVDGNAWSTVGGRPVWETHARMGNGYDLRAQQPGHESGQLIQLTECARLLGARWLRISGRGRPHLLEYRRSPTLAQLLGQRAAQLFWLRGWALKLRTQRLFAVE